MYGLESNDLIAAGIVRLVNGASRRLDDLTQNLEAPDLRRHLFSLMQA
jgi:hypothetical protein